MQDNLEGLGKGLACGQGSSIRAPNSLRTRDGIVMNTLAVRASVWPRAWEQDPEEQIVPMDRV